MSQWIEQGNSPSQAKGSPWVLFYLSALLGLVLGAWQSGFAETATGGVISVPVATAELYKGTSLSAPAGSSESGQPGASLAPKGHTAVTIPGIQSAILTVSKEISTIAPIVNTSPKPVSSKAPKGMVKSKMAQMTSLSNSAGKPDPDAVKATANLSRVQDGHRQGYYLELQPPQNTASAPSTLPGKDSIGAIAPASSVPVAPVASEWLRPANESTIPGQEETSSVVGAVDPELAPLQTATGAAMSRTATEALVRVTLGLVAVLGLLLAFSKGVLPRLVARYPRFFENLRRQNTSEQSKKSAEALAANTYFQPISPEYSPEPLTEAMTTDAISSGAPSSLEVGTLPSPTLIQKAAVKRYGFLLRALRGRRKKTVQAPPPVQESPFKLLHTSALGKDKELHLVEIKGRTLVIASTPYAITLIRDFSTASDSAEPTAEASSVSTFNDVQGVSGETAWSPQLLLAMTPDGDPLSPDALGRALETVARPRPETSPEQGTVEVQSFSFIRPKSNTYAARPSRFIPLSEGDRLYQRYLEILAPKSHLEAEETVLPAPSLQSVVILSEYDDTYGY